MSRIRDGVGWLANDCIVLRSRRDRFKFGGSLSGGLRFAPTHRLLSSTPTASWNGRLRCVLNLFAHRPIDAVAAGFGLNDFLASLSRIQNSRIVHRISWSPIQGFFVLLFDLFQGLRKNFDPGYWNEWTFGP